MAHCVSAPRGLAVGDLRHDRLLRRFRRHCRLGKHHLVFLRHFSEFHHGIPCERWLRALLNRIDPILFGRCFNSWIAALWPNRHEFIAIAGKRSRRTHDQRKGLKALHTLSAYPTHARLTLAQLSVPEKTNELTATPDLSDRPPT